jgi:hypothetical protein
VAEEIEMSTKAEIVPAGGWALARQASRDELTVDELIGQVAKIQQVMHAVMKKDEHYGVIPGTQKPSLLKAGAEKLCLLFRLDPQYESTEAWDGKHLTIKSKCTLYHIATGERRGSGEGSCSTKESKYAYRQAKRVCPKCGKDAINRSKYPPRGAPKNAQPGWYCYSKVGGCGAEFGPQDPAILDQQIGRAPNDDIADQYNTVLKMANKRSLVAAVLNVTAASDIFTQDLEDLAPMAPPPDPEPAKRYTDEEMAASKAKPMPAREEKPTSPPEEGFGEEPQVVDAPATDVRPDAGARYGVPLNQKQITVFHAKIDEKAKKLGISSEAMKTRILERYEVMSSKDLGCDVWDEVNGMIFKFKADDLGVAQ